MRHLLLTLLAASISCVLVASEEQLSTAQASELAARLANKQCQHRFHSSPFNASASTSNLVDGRWHWKASTGFGRGDLAADVSFSRSGQDPRVTIQLMDNRR